MLNQKHSEHCNSGANKNKGMMHAYHGRFKTSNPYNIQVQQHEANHSKVYDKNRLRFTSLKLIAYKSQVYCLSE
jgi:hypothetical protein